MKKSLTQFLNEKSKSASLLHVLESQAFAGPNEEKGKLEVGLAGGILGRAAGTFIGIGIMSTPIGWFILSAMKVCARVNVDIRHSRRGRQCWYVKELDS